MRIEIPNISFDHPTYIVGGFCRDKIIDPDSNPKDIDLCMVCDSTEQVEEQIGNVGGKIFQSNPEFLTVRCMIPELGAVDIAVARRDGDYSDGRRPDSTEVADNITEDLARRDATVNAIAVDVSNGDIVDPFDGVGDIERRLIRAVGEPMNRIQEDYLRLLRYLRFSITKGFNIDPDIEDCFIDIELIRGLRFVSVERIREEMLKCFQFDTNWTLTNLERYPILREEIFSRGLWLKPSLEQ